LHMIFVFTSEYAEDLFYYPLCDLCGSSEAGGLFWPIYPHIIAWTSGIAEGLRDLLDLVQQVQIPFHKCVHNALYGDVGGHSIQSTDTFGFFIGIRFHPCHR